MTATRWRGPQPRWRGRLVLRRGYLVALAAAVLLTLAAGWLVVVPLTLLVAGVLEGVLLYRAVGRAVRRTVAGAVVPVHAREGAAS